MADTEYPEALARLVDFFYTDEGAAVAIERLRRDRLEIHEKVDGYFLRL